MATILEALAEAKRVLLGQPGITGVSYKGNRIIVYAAQGTSVPSSFLGYEVEVVYTGSFKVF